MKRIVSALLVVVAAFVFAAACSQKDETPVAPPGPAPAPTSTPTRVCTPAGYGVPTVVVESPDAGSNTSTARNLGSITVVSEIKVLGTLTAGSDEADVYRLTYDNGGYYTQITCFNTTDDAIDFQIRLYDSTGAEIAYYSDNQYLRGACCVPSNAPGTYYIKIERVAGSGPYSLHVFAT